MEQADRQTLEVPLHNQKTGVWCATQIEGPIFLKILLKTLQTQEWPVSDIYQHFLNALWKKKRHMIILYKTVL
jgi:hypothetical protein